jgi:hypothetical protein
MKRKLIDIDVINGLENRSINVALKEIKEATEIIADKLKLGSLSLHCMNESEVTFVTPDDNYVHASYKIDNKNLLLENIKELVVNEESQRVSSIKNLSSMLESIIEEKNDEADEHFNSYINLPLNKKVFKESIRNSKKKIEESTKVKKINEFNEFGKLINKKKLVEWEAISENISEFINYKKGSNFKDNVKINEDENKNVVTINIPVFKVRNEAKILSFDWKTPNSQVTYQKSKISNQRSKAKCMVKENIFAKAMNDLRHANAISDPRLIESTLENIVGAWPDVLYLTKKELTNMIKESLDTVSAHNYDDEVCEFMADAVLRTAHNIYEDRAATLLKIAGLEATNDFEKFQEVSEALYPQMDEDYTKELKAFHDVSSALKETYSIASNMNNKIVKAKIQNILESIHEILNNNKTVDYKVLEEANHIISSIVEANVPLASKDWNVSDKPHTTVNGENPYTDKLAKIDAFPSKYNGDWKSAAPVSDGKSYSGSLDKEMGSAHTSSGKDIFPNLSNPYILKDVKPEVHDDSPNTVDSNNLATNQGGDTWPNLSNPYIPKNGMTLDQSFQHLNAK